MDHKRIYDQIVDRAKNRTLEGYKEKHHIVPKCIGGEDSQENIVHLTAREHFICHWLLHEMNPNDRGLSLAFSMMCNMENANQNRYTPSSRIIEYAKLAANKNSTGWKHSKEARKKISKAGLGNKYNLGRYPTQETRDKRSNSLKGRKFSIEHLEKLKIAAKSIEKREWLLKENRDPEKEAIRNKKISERKKGKSFSEEHRRKLSEAAKNRKRN